MKVKTNIKCSSYSLSSLSLSLSPSPSFKIRLAAHLSEAVTKKKKKILASVFYSQLRVREAWLLWAHFLKLSVFLCWVQKSLDHVTMWPLWQCCCMRIKEVINQSTVLGRQYCSLQPEQCSQSHHSAAAADSEKHTDTHTRFKIHTQDLYKIHVVHMIGQPIGLNLKYMCLCNYYTIFISLI